MQVDFLEKVRREATSNTPMRKVLAQATQMLTLARSVVELGSGVKDCRRPGGGAHDSSNNNTYTCKINKNVKGKGKQVDVVLTNKSSETGLNAVVSSTDTRAPLKLSGAIQIQSKKDGS